MKPARYVFELRATVVVVAPNVMQARRAMARMRAYGPNYTWRRDRKGRDVVTSTTEVVGQRVLWRGRG